MGSSLPNHDAKNQKGQTENRQKGKKEYPNADYIRHGQSTKKIEKNNLYDA